MDPDDQPPSTSVEDLLDVKVPRQAEDGTWQSVSVHTPTPPNASVAWGKQRFEAQASPVRWAADILEVVATAGGTGLPEVEAILECAEHPETWPDAKRLFTDARARWLREQPAPGVATPPMYLLGLAELVAKVIYNETTPLAPFDEDSGWYIAPVALDAAEVLGGEELAARVRRASEAIPDSPEAAR